MARAVCLVSGGLDSAVCLAIAASEGYECYALSFDYGQRHRVELDAARRVAHALHAREHVIVPLDLRVFGGSALTDDIAVPKARRIGDGHGHSGHLCAGAQHRVPVVRARVGGDAGRPGYLHRRECHRLFRLSGLPARIHSCVRENGELWRQGGRGRRT